MESGHLEDQKRCGRVTLRWILGQLDIEDAKYVGQEHVQWRVLVSAMLNFLVLG
jgi:hypothetical protein